VLVTVGLNDLEAVHECNAIIEKHVLALSNVHLACTNMLICHELKMPSCPIDISDDFYRLASSAAGVQCIKHRSRMILDRELCFIHWLEYG
jgi:hypothetical protein